MSYLKRRKYQRYLAPRVSHVHLETCGLLCESTRVQMEVDELNHVNSSTTGLDSDPMYFEF